MSMSLRTRAERWKSGVYLIKNTVNSKVYVGSSTRSIKYRWIRHRRVLRANVSSSHHLQSAWNKYGESTFEFSVLIFCAPEECVMYEQFFIDKHNSADPKVGYNISPTAGNCRGVVHTAETRAKMSLAGKGKKKSAETVAKVAAAQRGRKFSDEHRAKLSAAKKDKKLSAETVAKIVATKVGKKLSDEHKVKLSKVAQKRSADYYKKMWETRRRNATK